MVAISPAVAHRAMGPAPRRAVETAAWVEWLLGAGVVAVLCWGSWQIWWFYRQEIVPAARPVPAAPLPRVVRADDPTAIKRLQRSTDLLGEATTYATSNRREWARAAAERALAVDPDNAEAAALLRRLQQEPEATPTAAEREARQREQRLLDLLGAANAFLDAGQLEAAQPLVEQASDLAPDAPIVQQVRSRFANQAAGKLSNAGSSSG